MKLRNIFMSLLVLIAIGLVGCKKDWLDVNDDPEVTSEVDPEYLLFASQTEYSVNRTSEIGLSGSMWSQLWASGRSAGVFLNPERYIFSIFTTGNTWRTHYPNSQKNLKFAIEIAENSEPAKPLIAAQARTMSALIFYTTTILWGDIPYSEAINPEIDFPKFDKQEDVLNGLLGDLDVAIASFETPSGVIANDHYFSGDPALWAAFAKSLKFRILMLMVDKDPSKTTEIQAMLAADEMMKAGGDALYAFQNASGAFNPNWNVLNTFAGGQNFFYFASEVTVETMKKYNDPRLTIYFDPGTDTSGIKGVYPGETGSYEKDALISLNVVTPTSPERVFTHTEQLFLEAEAESRFGSVVNAEAKLRAAITSSMQYWGVAQTDIDAYLAANVTGFPALTPEQRLQLIAEQCWIAFIDKPIEAWTMWRRLEFPQLLLPNGATLGSFVRRLPYPPDELSANRNAPSTPNLDSPMWFDIPTSNP